MSITDELIRKLFDELEVQGKVIEKMAGAIMCLDKETKDNAKNIQQINELINLTALKYYPTKEVN